ncbi:putative defense protein 3 isoform X1 [Haemaphysalis longicornis]
MARLSLPLLVLLSLAATMAFPDGAPEFTCDPFFDLRPVHAETDALDAKNSPYRLVQEKMDFEANDRVKVTLYTVGKPFRGFKVKSVDEHGQEVGRFEPGALYKALSECAAATHESRADKEHVEMHWLAPADRSGRVHFKATVVHKYFEFYMNLTSALQH